MPEDDRLRRLASDLTDRFSRMLRSYLERLRRPEEEDAALDQYLRKVQIFLSHSKRDRDGERIAKLIREALFHRRLGYLFRRPRHPHRRPLRSRLAGGESGRLDHGPAFVAGPSCPDC